MQQVWPAVCGQNRTTPSLQNHCFDIMHRKTEDSPVAAYLTPLCTFRQTWPWWSLTKYTAMILACTGSGKAGESGPWRPRSLCEWTSGSTVCEPYMYHSKSSMNSRALYWRHLVASVHPMNYSFSVLYCIYKHWSLQCIFSTYAWKRLLSRSKCHDHWFANTIILSNCIV